MDKIDKIVAYIIFGTAGLLIMGTIVLIILIGFGVIPYTSDGTHHPVIICNNIGAVSICNTY